MHTKYRFLNTVDVVNACPFLLQVQKNQVYIKSLQIALQLRITVVSLYDIVHDHSAQGSEHWPHDYTLATCDSVNLQFCKKQTSACTTVKTQMVPPDITGRKQHTLSVFSIRVNNRSVILSQRSVSEKKHICGQ